MKRIFAIILVFFFMISLNGFGQVDEKVYKPAEGDFGVVFNISGLISNIGLSPTQDPFGNDLILGRAYVKDNHVVRLGIGVKSFDNKISLIDSVGSAERTLDSTYKKFNFYISPGYEYHFKGLARLDPYIGANLNFGLLGKTNSIINESLKDTTGVNKTEISYQSEGGFMFGVSALVGFNYFVAQNLALGAEYGLGFYSSREGGDWERVTVITPVSGNNVSRREVGTQRSSITGFNMSGNLSINLSYYFGRNKS